MDEGGVGTPGLSSSWNGNGYPGHLPVAWTHSLHLDTPSSFLFPLEG